MEFSFTAEQEELRKTVRRFLDNESTEQTVRKLMETPSGYDPRVWQRMASELSLVGLAIPEQYGGAGLSAVETGLAMEEMGRALFCGPYLSTAVLASGALLRCASEAAKKRFLPEIASGKTIATLAVAEQPGHLDIAALKTSAKRDGSSYKIDGIKNFVLDGASAGVIFVAAREGGALSLFACDANASGLGREPLPTLDLTRKLGRISFSGASAEKISSADISAPLADTIALATAILAAEQAGGAARCLDMATEYAKTRLQFGRAIGSFQAIKHKCADMLVEVEFARSAAYNAAFAAADSSRDDLAAAADIAKSYCSEAFFHCAAENIQIHGGMGFTWEHPAHLYFKRARASSVIFGDPIEHRDKLAASLGI